MRQCPAAETQYTSLGILQAVVYFILSRLSAGCPACPNQPPAAALHLACCILCHQVRQAAVSQVLEVAQGLGCSVAGTMESPLKGDRAGNTEYLVHLVVGGSGAAGTSPCLSQPQQHR